ncbi:MAG: ferroxidase type 3 [Chloroflexi bacterium]|nr:ferroxidase type 3 [Chloroflexota bacterium]
MSGVMTMRGSAHLRGSSWLVLLVTPVLVAGTLLASAAVRPVAAATEGSNRIGVVCTTSSSPNPTFTLTTRQGYINLADGTTAYMWGFSEGGKPFQHPGPTLCVNEGDTVTVVLSNAFTGTSAPKKAPAVSIVFPGQENVLADGAPSQPQFDGSGNLTSLAQAAQPGGSVSYSFVASKPGTFLYESGGGQLTSGSPSPFSSPQIQVRMGLFGALIVRPAMGANFVYDRADSQFNPDTEFMILLSEIDPYLNAKVLKGTAFNMNTYHPRYWLINGRQFPDSIADNFASWLPTQPYGSIAPIHPYDATANPWPAVDRYLSVGSMDFPFHPHGNNGKVIGRDGSPLAAGAGEDMSFDKFAVNIGPGQTWDLLFDWKDNEGYSPTNPVPASEPDLQNLTIGMFYSGSPYLGVQEAMPPGISTLNECGEFYIIAHNHALHQLTSWGVNMTGPITYTRVDPPLPNSCP